MTTFNTGNPLGSTDVYDRYDNSENLDNFSNGPLDAYADRLGVMRQSLQGIRNASQYVILGPYGPGLNFTAKNEVFSYLGEFYAPGPSITLPYTTTGAGAGEIANFRNVGDALLRTDLADDTKGAGIVAFDSAENYSAGTTGAELNKLGNAVIPCVFDFMTRAEIDDVKSGTPALDHTTALQAAIDGTTGELSLGSGGWTFNVTRLTGRTGLNLSGSATLDFSANPTYATSVSDPLFKIWGTAGSVVLATANISQYDTLISVASTSGISANDLIEIATPGATGGFEDSSIVVSNGEICQVSEVVSGTQLRLADPVIDLAGYSTANAAQIRKLNTVDNVVIGAGITIVGKGRPQPTGAGDYGLVLMYARSPRIHCSFKYVDLVSLRFEGCYDYEASGCTVVMNVQGSNTVTNYGIVPSGSSKHGRVFDTKCANMRHAIVSSHLSSALGLDVWGVVRCLDVYDNTIINTWHAAIATHSDIDTVSIYDNRIYGCLYGVNPRERNVIIRGNLMVRCAQAVYLTARPRDISIVGNTAVGCTGSFLITALAGTRDLTGITIEGNEIIRCAGGISLTLFTPISGHRRFSIKNNNFREVVGSGGSQALIRVVSGPLVDSTISNNVAQDCTGIGGILLDGGSTRLQLLNNNMWDVDGNSFTTTVTAGAYTNCYGKGNVSKTGSWSGNANVTNGATIIADNTFF